MRRRDLLPVIVLVCSLATSVRAQSKGEEGLARFQRGFYLQVHDADPARAAVEYEAVVADPAVAEEVRREARARLAQCREEIAAEDLARLMPADAMAYIEIKRPGKHAAELIRMLGLGGPVAAKATAPKPTGIPVAPGIELPADFAISPALVAELSKIRGVAAAITSVNRQGIPQGVAVVHPGDSDLLRGLSETGVQTLPMTDAIDGFATYVVEKEVWIVRTARLFIVASSKSQAAAAVERLKNPSAESLATSAGFKDLAKDRSLALGFAYLSGPRLLPVLASQLRFEELAIARAVLDLDHLQSLSATLRVQPHGVEAAAKVRFSADHHNLAYALVRTAPATRRSLAHVPSSAAAVVLVGLNPAEPAGAKRAAAGEPSQITAMDLGREVFANIEEVSAFLLAPSGGEGGGSGGLPEVGLVFAVKDAAKSAAVWNQLLALPAMAGLPFTQAAQPVEIGGRTGKQYVFPFVPPIVVVEHPDRLLLAGTQGAVAAALGSGAAEKSITKDAAFAPRLAQLTPYTSKAVLVDVGRTLKIASAFGGREGREMAEAANLIDGLTVSVASHESPTELAIGVQVTGLPNVLKLAAAMAQPRARSPEAAAATPRRATRAPIAPKRPSGTK